MIQSNTILYYWQCLLKWLAHPSQFVVSDGAGIHEGLGDDGQHGIHVVRGLHVKDELWVLQDIDPEAQGQTVWTEKKVDAHVNKDV